MGKKISDIKSRQKTEDIVGKSNSSQPYWPRQIFFHLVRRVVESS